MSNAELIHVGGGLNAEPASLAQRDQLAELAGAMSVLPSATTDVVRPGLENVGRTYATVGEENDRPEMTMATHNSPLMQSRHWTTLHLRPGGETEEAFLVAQGESAAQQTREIPMVPADVATSAIAAFTTAIQRTVGDSYAEAYQTAEEGTFEPGETEGITNPDSNAVIFTAGGSAVLTVGEGDGAEVIELTPGSTHPLEPGSSANISAGDMGWTYVIGQNSVEEQAAAA